MDEYVREVCAMPTVHLRLVLQQHLVRLVTVRLRVLYIMVTLRLHFMRHYDLLIRLTFSNQRVVVSTFLLSTCLVKMDFLKLLALLIVHVVMQRLVCVMLHLLLKDERLGEKHQWCADQSCN
jgi:hypothetical protein